MLLTKKKKKEEKKSHEIWLKSIMFTNLPTWPTQHNVSEQNRTEQYRTQQHHVAQTTAVAAAVTS